MGTPADCSLCHQPFLSLTQLRRHMGMHLEQLALFAIPPNLGETEDGSEAGSNKEAEKESIGSGRTESEADDDETASNKEAPHDGRTKESEELAEDAIDTGEGETVQVIEERSDKERPRRIVVEERRRSNIMGTDEESSSEEEGDSERPQAITVEERRRSGHVEINGDIVEVIEDHGDIEPPRKRTAREKFLEFLRTGIPPKDNYGPPRGRSPPDRSPPPSPPRPPHRSPPTPPHRSSPPPYRSPCTPPSATSTGQTPVHQFAPGTLISSSKEEKNVEDEEAATKGKFFPKDKDSSMNDSTSTAVESIRVQPNLTPVTSAQPTAK